MGSIATTATVMLLAFAFGSSRGGIFISIVFVSGSGAAVGAFWVNALHCTSRSTSALPQLRPTWNTRIMPLCCFSFCVHEVNLPRLVVLKGNPSHSFDV